MPKIDCNYHSKNTRRKDCKNDLNEREYRDEDEHNPLRLEKEYVRALNATKVDKFMGKPFIGAYMMHNEGINKLEMFKHDFITSSYSNEVLVWDLQSKSIRSKMDFDSVINSVGLDRMYAYVSQNKSILKVKRNTVEESVKPKHNPTELYSAEVKMRDVDRFTNKFKGETKYDGKIDLDHYVNHFEVTSTKVNVASNGNISIFDQVKSCNTFEKKGMCKFVKGSQSLNGILCGLNETELFSYDARAGSKIFSIEGPYNCLELFEGNMFLGGSGYAKFDLRDISKPLRSFDTSSGVLSIGVTKTTKNENRVVLGCIDNIIYNFKNDKMDNIYYNQRMGIVHGVKYSTCGNFVVSGSDDGSIRLWKSDANQKTVASGRQRGVVERNKALQEKFKDVGEIHRIQAHKFLPKEIKNKLKNKRTANEERKARLSRKK